MEKYIYQDWYKGKRKLQTEEQTLIYYSKHVYYPDHMKEKGKEAKKFLKTCTSAEEWARYAYANDLPFSVCKMDAHHVEAYIRKEFLEEGLSVAFLDEYGRKFMGYSFNRQPNGKYFCIGIIFWEFEEGKSGDNDDTKTWIYTFEPNGNVEVIEREKGAKEECVWKSKRPLNVESNWEDAPAFGNWDGLFEMKRWKEGELDELFKGDETSAADQTDQPVNKWLPPGWNKE
ncbi:hypothetical protein [Pedobacter steynii]|uniref:Uncharacterized protein n=1 Tax=Pedobacter steynii TaxID=430522 RepID=A0A1D7QFP8_9SPHI|nr:hypothetical protein [Pedobacter steynii]AOM77399.1 hypothetical protein BFS30_09605 [Pedobacter steynii]